MFHGTACAHLFQTFPVCTSGLKKGDFPSDSTWRAQPSFLSCPMTLIRGLPSHTFAPTANQGRLMFCACPELNSRYLDPDQLRGLLCPARMRTAESLCAYVWTNHRPSRLTALENGGQVGAFENGIAWSRG